MAKKRKIETNWRPVDIASGFTPKFGFTSDSTPATNSADYQSLVGRLAEKNFADLIQNDDIRNKDASYIIGGRLFEAVVDVNGGGDYTTIQEALDAGNKRIFVRNGIYIIKTSITASGEDILFTGESTDGVVIKFEDTVDVDLPIIYLYYVTNFYINNLTIYGNRETDPTATQDGILIKGGDYIKIDNCKITQNSQYGINTAYEANELNYPYYVSVERNKIRLNLGGINLPGTQHRINDNRISNFDTNGYGINISDRSFEILIANNFIDGSGTDDIGINVAGLSSGININSNSISGFYNSVVLNYCLYSFISNNFLYNAKRDAVKIIDCNMINIIGNELRPNPSTDNLNSAIILRGDSHESIKNIITGNNILGRSAYNLKYGVYEEDSSQNYNLVSNNITEYCKTDGIFLQGANSIKANNIEV